MWPCQGRYACRCPGGLGEYGSDWNVLLPSVGPVVPRGKCPGRRTRLGIEIAHDKGGWHTDVSGNLDNPKKGKLGLGSEFIGMDYTGCWNW